MALKDRLDSDFTNKILKKTLMGSSKEKAQAALNDNVLVSQDSIVKISNSLTSLQNAFNKIYAHTLNVRNLHQYDEKRAASIKKESSLESKIAPGASSNTPDTSGITSFSSTIKSMDELGTSIERLNDKLSTLNLGGNSLLDLTASIGGGFAGGALGARGGAAVGAMAGPWGAAAGAAIGGLAGSIAGSSAGETASDTLQRRAAGGTVKAGGAYIIGERGPEVMFFNGASGRVAPYGRRGAQTQAEKTFVKAADQSAKARAKLEKGQPLGPTSYSAKFSNYLSSLFANMPAWVERVRKFLTPTGGGDADASGAYFGGEYTELTADEIANSARGQNKSGSSDWRTDREFLAEINNVAREHNINPRAILGLIASESGFDPKAVGDNGAFGLFQFVPRWHTGARGTTPIARIRQMSRAEQVRYANEQYFRRYDIPAGASAGALYASIFAPSVARGVRYDRSAPLYRRGTEDYRRNEPLDSNDDGIITIADLDDRIVGKVREFNLPGLSAASGFVSRDRSVGTVTSRRGQRGDSYHRGTDIAAPEGTVVASLGDGVITRARYSDTYGNVVYIRQDDGYEARYAHLSGFAPGVRSGIRVSATQIIGYVGNTGRSRGATGHHLHFELRRGNEDVESYDIYNENKWIVGGAPMSRAVSAPPARDGNIITRPPRSALPAGYESGVFTVNNNSSVRGVRTRSGIVIPALATSAEDVRDPRALTTTGRREVQAYFEWLRRQ